ncbi:hypothetical protein Pla100_48750 [Neorhodopirellula pilleata]|uniref:Uncharacterized protein n=1 Tax=Neorhodopirellula pilleata TaxID=2714738 RepID=A0A5C5ZY49_9BACT|nr:hypothetical protein Pla100_48750 [Neorhodopirellula pilleata]
MNYGRSLTFQFPCIHGLMCLLARRTRLDLDRRQRAAISALCRVYAEAAATQPTGRVPLSGMFDVQSHAGFEECVSFSR